MTDNRVWNRGENLEDPSDARGALRGGELRVLEPSFFDEPGQTVYRLLDALGETRRPFAAKTVVRVFAVGEASHARLEALGEQMLQGSFRCRAPRGVRVVAERHSRTEPVQPGSLFLR